MLFIVIILAAVPILWGIAEVKNSKSGIRILLGILTMIVMVFYTKLSTLTDEYKNKAKHHQVLILTKELLKAGKHEEVLKALEGNDPHAILRAEMNKLENINNK